MHVLQLLPRLDVGGVERGVLDLAKGLLRRGHRVSVVSGGGSLVERLTQLGATHHELPVHEKSLSTMWRCVGALERIIRTTDVDLVHARSRVPAWIGYVAARGTQRPFLTTAHGFYAPHPGSYVMGWGRVVIAPSEALGRDLSERFHLPKDRLRVIPRGVDLEAFTFQPPRAPHLGPWRIGLIGRLSPLKGHEVALRACAQLRRRGHDVRLCMVGQTSDAQRRRALDTLIAALALEGAVEWMGHREDVPSLIASMDCIVVPSVYPESFGRSVIEAQAVGRPVVASRLGALAEVVEDGVTGLLVRPGDPGELCLALERLINDEALRAQCVEAARRRVESRWTVDRMVEQTLEVYTECLTKPRILIWKLRAVGDVILATPSLRAIRHQFPHAAITLVVGRAAYEVVARCPYVNDILIYDPQPALRGAQRRLTLLTRLRRGAFDLSIDLQNSRETHLLAWLAGIPVRVGYGRKYAWLLNRAVRLPRVVLAPIAHQHYLLRQAGFSTDGEALELWPSPIDERSAERLLREDAGSARRPLVGLHPGGSGRWKTKRWDLSRWARLCDLLTDKGVRVIVTGAPQERDLGEALTRLTDSRPLLLIGKTSLMELACILKRCDVFVTHDTAPLHLAAAVGTPTVALFGPTDPPRHLPATFTGVVMKKDVFCSPCYSATCRTITHACMKRISIEEVLTGVLGILADAEPNQRQLP